MVSIVKSCCLQMGTTQDCWLEFLFGAMVSRLYIIWGSSFHNGAHILFVEKELIPTLTANDECRTTQGVCSDRIDKGISE